MTSEPRHRVIEARIHAFRNAAHTLVYTVSDLGAATNTVGNSTAAATDPAIIACALANAREQLLQLKLALFDGASQINHSSSSSSSSVSAHFDPQQRAFVVQPPSTHR